MGGGFPREQTCPMLTPIVTEIPRALEPVGRDTFLGVRDLANVVRLPSRESAERPAVLLPARAA
jgi:hypothetical protein